MRLTWDGTGERLWESGIRKCVMYPINKTSQTYPIGYAWNGVTGITEGSNGGDPNKIYADDIPYAVVRSVEEFTATITAYTYPLEFAKCDGSAVAANGGLVMGQQPRKMFGLCYRTILGNDVLGEEYGYNLHLVYGCTASPSDRDYQTTNDSPELIEFSWEIDTLPVDPAIEGQNFKPVSRIIVDSVEITKAVGAAKLKALEDVLYGTNATTGDNPTPGTDARLPLPDEVSTILGVSWDD